MKRFNSYLDERACDLVNMKQIKAFEKFVDNMFKRFNIDFNFTKHFGDRMSDSRNEPCISMKELADFIKKIYKRQGKSIKSVAGAEAVIKDMQSDLNIPVAVKYDQKNDEFDVVMKTIMRKKNFHTPDKVIKYESYIAEAFNTKIKWTKMDSRSASSGGNIQKYRGKIDNQNIEMSYTIASTAPEVNIVFTVDGTMKVTGKGNQMKIFGAVINHITSWIKEHPEINLINFSSHKEDPNDNSRSKLYSRLVKRYASKMGFKVDEIDIDVMVLYILKRK